MAMRFAFDVPAKSQLAGRVPLTFLSKELRNKAGILEKTINETHVTGNAVDNVEDNLEAQQDPEYDERRRAILAKRYPKIEINKLNRIPDEHILALANDLLHLSPKEMAALNKECRDRLSVKPATPIPGLAARSPFPNPSNYFGGQFGMRTLPIGLSAFEPGIHFPPVSPFFGLGKILEQIKAQGEGQGVVGQGEGRSEA